MIDAPSADLDLIADTAARFFGAEAPVSAMRELRGESRSGFRPEVWAAAAQLGFAGVLVPEAFGGLGLDMQTACIIQQEIGRNLTLLPFLSSSILCAPLIAELGSEEQKAWLLPKIASGTSIVALAHEERARHSPAASNTVAVPNGDHFLLDGRKTFVVDGAAADHMLVSAHVGSGSDEIALFLVDAEVSGVDIEPCAALDGRRAAQLQLASVRVAKSARVGNENCGSAIERALDRGRVALAADLMGVATESFERTVEYLKTREQFGVKIGSFQALQHRAAQLFCELEQARHCVEAAAQAIDATDDRSPLLASLAKGKTTQVARLVTSEAVQMHGGVGMTDELDIGLFLKRAQVAGEMLGDYDFHRERLAQLWGY